MWVVGQGGGTTPRAHMVMSMVEVPSGARGSGWSEDEGEREREKTAMHMCMRMHMYMCMCMYMLICVYGICIIPSCGYSHVR